MHDNFWICRYDKTLYSSFQAWIKILFQQILLRCIIKIDIHNCYNIFFHSVETSLHSDKRFKYVVEFRLFNIPIVLYNIMYCKYYNLVLSKKFLTLNNGNHEPSHPLPITSALKRLRLMLAPKNNPYPYDGFCLLYSNCNVNSIY